MVKKTSYTIGLDLDGVILDFSETKKRIAEELGFSIALAETPTEIIERKITPAIYNEMQVKLYTDVDIAQNLPLIAGAREGIHNIKSRGMPYFIISRRRTPEIAVASLKLHGLWPTYFTNKNSFFVIEKRDKDTKSMELGVNTFLDDEPSVLAELTSVSNRFLLDPFGVYNLDNTNIKKVSTWPEFIKHLK